MDNLAHAFDGESPMICSPQANPNCRTPAALAARHSHLKLGPSVPRPAPDPVIYQLANRPWRVVPMALLAILSVLAIAAGTGWATRSALGTPDPGQYVNRVIDRAEAATL